MRAQHRRSRFRVMDVLRVAAEPMVFRATADGTPMLSGHFAVFDRWTEVNSLFEGNFMERVASGSFAKTIRDDLPAMKVLLNHGRDTLGLQTLGTIETLREDDKGAFYEVALNRGIPELVMEGLRKGQYGASFRFQVNRMAVVERPKRSDYNPKALPERTIQEAMVREFGPVTFPQYQEATAVARSATDDFLTEWIRREPELVRSILNLRNASTAARATERRETKPLSRREFIECLSR
jgi:HK97 family phage prohead protease